MMQDRMIPPAAMRKPLRQLLFVSLLAASPWVMANTPLARAESMFESADQLWAAEGAPSSTLGLESDGRDLLQQHTPRGHAWGLWALSADAQRPQSFKAAEETSQPAGTETVASPAPEPEPASAALMLVGMAAGGLFIRRRRPD